MASSQRPRVFLDVNIGEEPAGRLTIELFTDKTPKTCENFRQLCTGEHNGLSYAKAPFHRVIDEFMIQGGDIEKGDGTGVASIYDGEYEDESLDWIEMNAAGLVCSANRGRDTNGSQFFITLEPCEHLNGKHTIFGRLVSGESTLQRIAKVDVDDKDRPLEPVLVSRCGELERKKKQVQPTHVADGRVSSASRDRGRRRRSGDSDVEMSTSPPPRAPPKARRQSDNVVDEGLRGRPRNRTHSRSPSQAIHETDESASGVDSPVEKHKRKRSHSPNRATAKPVPRPDQSASSTYSHRRRPSLPNQYGDEDRYRPSPRRDNNRFAGRGNERRRDDRYRPRDRYMEDGRLRGSDGRLGGSGDYDENDPPVKYKGRGSMKYREPGRL